jgi:hypothetical protein
MRRVSVVLALLLALVLTFGVAWTASADAPSYMPTYSATVRAFGGDGTGPEGYLTAMRTTSGTVIVRATLYYIEQPRVVNISIQRGNCAVPAASALWDSPAFSPNPFGMAQIRYLLPEWEWRQIVADESYVTVRLANTGPNEPNLLCGDLEPVH